MRVRPVFAWWLIAVFLVVIVSLALSIAFPIPKVVFSQITDVGRATGEEDCIRFVLWDDGAFVVSRSEPSGSGRRLFSGSVSAQEAVAFCKDISGAVLDTGVMQVGPLIAPDDCVTEIRWMDGSTVMAIRYPTGVAVPAPVTMLQQTIDESVSNATGNVAREPLAGAMLERTRKLMANRRWH